MENRKQNLQNFQNDTYIFLKQVDKEERILYNNKRLMKPFFLQYQSDGYFNVWFYKNPVKTT